VIYSRVEEDVFVRLVTYAAERVSLSLCVWMCMCVPLCSVLEQLCVGVCAFLALKKEGNQFSTPLGFAIRSHACTNK
jgi:hypothetical protein